MGKTSVQGAQIKELSNTDYSDGSISEDKLTNQVNSKLNSIAVSNVNYESGYVNWGDSLTNEIVQEFILPDGNTFVIQKLEAREKGSDSEDSDFSIDVYDASASSIIGSSVNLEGTPLTSGSVTASGSDKKIVIRVSNTTSIKDATVILRGYTAVAILPIDEFINYETGYVNWEDDLSNEIIHEFILPDGMYFNNLNLEVRDKSSDTENSNFSIDVYDASGSSIIAGSVNLEGSVDTSGYVQASGSDKKIVVRLTNTSGNGAEDANIILRGFIGDTIAGTLSNKIDKVSSASEDDIPVFNNSGGIASSGISIEDIFPIGMTYIQLPGELDPADLNLPGSWENKSSELAGDFIRFEGGAANAFNNTQQLDQYQGHDHYIHIPVYGGFVGNTAGGYGANLGRSGVGDSAGTLWRATSHVNDGSNGNPRIGTETRVVNRTARKWRRIS